MNLKMMNESSKRHPKLLSLILTLNCLSKTSVIRMFVYYFSLKTSRKTCPSVLHEFQIAYSMLLPYQSSITTLIVYARPKTSFGRLFPLLFSRLNYTLALNLKVQVKLCTSVDFFFSHKRERS